MCTFQLVSAVFRAKVLEAHLERLGQGDGPAEGDSGSSASGSEVGDEFSHVEGTNSPPVLSDEGANYGEVEDVSIHTQHEEFLQRQIELATRHKESRTHLPRAVSSKRKANDDKEELESSKKMKLAVSTFDESEQGLQKGPRTVSSAEKNRRRKLKKKKRLIHKS